MADQHKAHVYNSRDLLLKSNPALFENIPDVTNPREIYNFLSKTHARSLTDMSKIHSVAEDNISSVATLSRTTSMKDLRKAAGLRTDSRREKHFSSNDLSRIHQKDPSITALFINAPYLSIDDLRYLPGKESQKPAKPILTLPYLRKERTQLSDMATTPSQRKRNRPNDGGGDSDGVSFPVIKSERMDTIGYGSHGEEKSTRRQQKTLHDGNNPEIVHTKLDKWFSDMPGEVVDKANRAVMEETIKDKIQSPDENERKRKYKTTTLPHPLPLLKPLPKMPQQYSELRVRDSHRDYKPTTIDRDQYKLRQKSLLKLKTSGSEEHKSKSSPPVQYEPPTNSYGTDRFVALERKPSPRDLISNLKKNGNGLTTIDIEEFAMEAYVINPSEKFTFAKQNEENGSPQQSLLKRSNTTLDMNTRCNSRSAGYVYGDDRGKHPHGAEKLQRALTIVKVDKHTVEELRAQYKNRKQTGSDASARETSSASKTLSLFLLSETY